MQGPEDFGLSAVRTLARVGSVAPAPGHSIFWQHWHAAVDAAADAPGAGRILARSPADLDPSDPSADHAFVSLGGVRVGCRLDRPTGPPSALRGAVILLHGSDGVPACESDAARWSALRERGLMTLALRVRGFAGSRTDTGDLARDTGFAARGLDAIGVPNAGGGLKPERVMSWSLPQAVADVVLAARALRAMLPEGAMLGLMGESFGGGLAVIAAAQLGAGTSRRAEIDRLVVSLPSLGDWPWRMEHPVFAPPTHAGSAIRAALDAARPTPRYQELLDAVRLCDAVVHAPKVRAWTLCKLAERDDVVPAPAAAAVFNALGADPGRKWRFVTPFGHFDGGLRAARRHALFDRAAVDFFDPASAPDAQLARWEPALSGASDHAPTPA